MRSEVTMLPENPKTLDLTKRDLFQLNLSQISGKSGLNCCSAGFGCVWDPWTRSLSKVVLKQDLLGIEVTTHLGVNNF